MPLHQIVDYNAHIVIKYYETKEAATRNKRVQEVLLTMGISILLGGFTTFLGVLPLSFTSFEVFRTFFFIFLGITSLSSLHGMVFVPVVLSIVGPHEHLLRQRHNEMTELQQPSVQPKAESLVDSRAIERLEI